MLWADAVNLNFWGGSGGNSGGGAVLIEANAVLQPFATVRRCRLTSG